jgi:hypothetical protein
VLFAAEDLPSIVRNAQRADKATGGIEQVPAGIPERAVVINTKSPVLSVSEGINALGAWLGQCRHDQR